MNYTEMDKSRMAVPLDLAWLGRTSSNPVPHISVCICSYRGPKLLKRLLLKLNNQVTEVSFHLFHRGCRQRLRQVRRDRRPLN